MQYKYISFRLLIFALFNIQISLSQIQFEETPPFSTDYPITNNFTPLSNGNVAFADIDNDGDEDVFINGSLVNNNDEVTELYKNDGNGNFSLVENLDFVNFTYGDIKFADIDNDGDQDLMMCRILPDNNEIILYENDGQGNFTEIEYTDFINPSLATITFADYDQDGDQDVLISGSSNLCELYENDGNGNFSVVVNTPFEGIYYGQTAFADIDNDNDLDILISGQLASPGVAKTTIYINNGGNSFTEMTENPFLQYRFCDAAFADIDNDDDQDIVICGITNMGYKSTIYENDGAGNYTIKDETSLIPIFHCSISFGDVDNDSDSDLILTGVSSSGDISFLYLNDGEGNFIENEDNTFYGTFSGELSFSDIDNDSDIDLLILGRTKFRDNFFLPNTQLYINNGDAQFNKVKRSSFIEVNRSTVDFADIDGDSDLDLLITGLSLENIYNTTLYENNGNSEFSIIENTSFPNIYAGAAKFSDVDNDNDFDILIGGNTEIGAVTKLYLNNGDGTFVEDLDSSFADFKNGTINFADIDGDGDDDVLMGGVLNTGDISTKLYENDGSGNFSELPVDIDAIRTDGVDFGDIDGDDDLDVIISGTVFLTDDIFSDVPISKLYENDGDGNFTEIIDTPLESIEKGDVKFIDIDGDEDLDILLTGEDYNGDGHTLLYENDSYGNYTENTASEFIDLYRSSICFTDVDGDNDLDLFLSGAYPDPYTDTYISVIYENDGTGFFSQVQGTPFEGVHLGNVAFADIDMDNDSDLIITGKNSYGMPSTRLYKNFSCIPKESTDIHTACNEFLWIDGYNYTESNNTATHTIIDGATNGCDSIITLDLTILYNSVGVDHQISCESFEWIDGNIYTESNNSAVYNLPGASVNGCDSIVTLDLTINYNATSVDEQEACDSFTWIDGNTYTTSNDTATHTLSNPAANGCDSVIMLNLTINATASIDYQTACDSLTWIDGNTYTESNNTATYTLSNALGCDSVITLQLSINDLDVSLNTEINTISANIDNASYQWIDCNNNYTVIYGATNQSFTPTANGSYAVEITKNNCTDISECIDINNVNIPETIFQDQIYIYPNPNNGKVFIDLGKLKDVDIRLLNILGEEVYHKKNITHSLHQFQLDQKAGYYIIEITYNNISYSYKLIKL